MFVEKRYYSLIEAEGVLPEVRSLVGRMQKIKKALDLLCSIEIEYRDDGLDFPGESKFTQMNKEYHKLNYQFFIFLEQFECFGCVLKDLDQGLVDFFSVFNGREIVLCWKAGEKNIRYWHELDVGFSARKPIRMIREGMR